MENNIEIPIKKTADMKKYLRDYREAHKNDKFKCEICGVTYTKLNKSHHVKTQKHELAALRLKVDHVKNIL